METPETAQYGEFNTWSGVFSRPGSSRVTGVESVTSLLQTDPRSESGGRKRSSARCEAELIQARGRISQLELQLELGKTQQAAKRARRGELEEERESERQSLSTSRELQRLHTVRPALPLHLHTLTLTHTHTHNTHTHTHTHTHTAAG